MSSRWRRYGRTWTPILGLTALAGALRLVSLGRIPPGLYHDEAVNGLDALGVLDGSFRLYFPANHGREPLFLYLVAAAVGVLGRTPGAVRLAAAVCGTLTIPATYFMARAWFDRRIAFLSATLLTITLWHVQLSRVGFRAVLLPLAMTSVLWLGAHALKSGRPRTWLATGIVYGVTFYTYVAARVTPIILLGVAVYLLLTRRAARLWPGALYFGGGAALALMPLGIYTAAHWDVVVGRASQVSLFNPSVNQGDLWGMLGRSLIRTAGMFFVRGDAIPRHNVPGRPVFTPLMGAAMVVGTARAGARAVRRHLGSAAILISVATMLLPTIAAADAPHFLRAVGVLPALVVLPALGLDAAWRFFRSRSRRTWASVSVVLILIFSLGATVHDYFVRYRSSPQTAYAFEAAATQLASEINRFTGRGWDGRGLVASDRPVSDGRLVYVDTRLWQAWEAVPFLVPEHEDLIRFRPTTVPYAGGTDSMLLLLWPYDDYQRQLTSLPHPAQIEAHAGPLTRGDLEAEAYPAYASYRVEPLREQPAAPLAIFGDVIALTDVEIQTAAGLWEVRLSWSALDSVDQAYTIFVYGCRDDCQADRLVAQDDAPPGDGYYPTYLWRPSDVVVDTHTLRFQEDEPDPTQLALGLYAWPSVDRLPVTMPVGAAADDMFTLPVGE